jgi:hypothetical protein
MATLVERILGHDRWASVGLLDACLALRPELDVWAYDEAPASASG